jgi:fused signal recognition particle receptor
MALFSKLFAKIRGGSLSEQDWSELERSLIESDLGARSAHEVIELAKKVKGDSLEASVTEILETWLSTQQRDLFMAPERTTTILVIGVNGTGKTTSVAKLAQLLHSRGSTVMVAAADTFRAAAVEQLQTWGERIGIPVVAGKAQGDPASVAFDAISQAISRKSNYLIIDTAGRLHTKSGLMDELEKIRRVVEKISPIDEVLLVVDATTGQNGITQTKSFAEKLHVTGLIATKMDGSTKGGIALAIERETGLPVKFVGTGESIGDLQAFDSKRYLEGLISD